MIQAEQAARDGETAYYKSKICQLEDKCSQREDSSSQLRAELMQSKKQLFEDRISFEKRITQLQSELKQMPSSSAIQKTEALTSYCSDLLKPPRSSTNTYISMKDTDSPLYESIHSSMMHVSPCIYL